ncbi:MAG: aldo/keto reductase [Chloroflexota bacterium]|nr:aldo/keto reductase [Chloroflexota bacterium]
MVVEKVQLGATDVWVSPLGIGTWQWGDRWMWGYGKDYGVDDVRAAFEAAVESGVTFVDTAEVYGLGRSEKLLGSFIASSKAQVCVATKFFPFPWRVTKGQLVNALRQSLKRLGLQQVDLYQLHFPRSARAIETWGEALAEVVEAGLTRAVGVSNYNAEQTGRIYNVLAARGIPLATNQIHYSLLQHEPEHKGVLQTCRDLGVTIIAYSPLAKGLLTGKYTPQNLPAGLRRRMYDVERLAEIQPLIALMQEIGGAYGDKTPAQVALNWLLCKGTLPIPGAKNARHVRSNAGALGWRMTSAEVAALDEASEEASKRKGE